jgi:hypothetical protein
VHSTSARWGNSSVIAQTSKAQLLCGIPYNYYNAC